jgi:TetR/AcrR family transcriptional regulator
LSEAPSSRDKILDVAEALFARRGYTGVGLREVATQAGLGKSSLFHHFRSKAELYLAVLQRVFDRIDVQVAPAVACEGSALERLDAWIDGVVDALAEHPTTARLLLRGLFEDDDFPEEALPAAEAVEATLQALLRRIHDVLEAGIAEGELRDTAPGHVLQTLIGATVYHFASGEFGEGLIGAPLLSADAVARRKREIKSLIHHGLAAPAGPSAR